MLFERRIGEILRGLLMGLFLNLLLIGFCLLVKPEHPRTQVRLTTRADAVVVYGYGNLGNLVVKSFASWREAMAYIDAQDLEIPQISYAHLPQAEQISVSGQKITWGYGQRAKVLVAPDSLSTLKMAQYLRFLGLNAGPMGYSLNLQPR